MLNVSMFGMKKLA